MLQVFKKHLSMLSDIAPQLKLAEVFPYLLPSFGPGADPGVQVVSPWVTLSHPPSRRLPLLSARPEVTFLAKEHQCPLAGAKLYCLLTETHGFD